MSEALSNQNLWQYIRLYKPQAGRLALGNLCSLATGLALVPLPWIFGRVIDQRLTGHDMRGLLLDGALILGLYLAWLCLSVASRYLNLTVTKGVVYRLRADVVEKLQRLSIGYFDRQDLGRLHAAVIHDTERVDVMSNFLLSGLLVSGLTALVTLAVLAWMDWRLTALVAALLPLVWLAQRFFKSRILARHRAWKEQFEGFSAKVQELLHAMRLVRAYANEDHEQARIEATAASLSQRGVEWVTLINFYQGLMEVLMGVAQVLVICYGGWRVMQGGFSAGQLVAFYGFLALLFTPVRNIVANMDQYFAGRASLDALYAILHGREIEPPQPGGLALPVAGEVEARGLGFSYPNGTRALDGVGFTARPGQTVALVGRSGSGKSTLAHLLLGFYQAQDGELLVDGRPLAAWDRGALRRQMGVVPQQGLVLSGTVRSNILYGKLEAGDAEVWRAAELACADGFIRQLGGLDAEVGELGARLSGGQRQRLAIARALLRDPRILILDEATSALDTLSEAAVQQAVDNLKAGRTTFVIAHRLSTVRKADQVLVLDAGRVVQRGSHRELMAKDGPYRALAEGQLLKDEDLIATP